ncbi:reverse transcriptase domain-containing protein [Tanacetum coccineum]
MMGQMQKTLQERPQGVLPSNTVPNPREELKAITTRSGVVLVEPSVLLPPLYSSSKEVERDPETITDQVLPESTTRVPPLVVQPSSSSRTTEIPLSPSSPPSKLPKRNPHQPPIPYPLRMNKEKLQDKFDIQVHKFLQMFKKLHFNISLAEALALMPKYAKMLNGLLFDKEKLLGLANTSLTKNCSAKKLVLSELIPTRMTIELANRSVAYPAGIAEDICIQVGKFTFPADFVVVGDVDPRVPLILGRPFLRTARALVNVYGEELILRDGDEKLIFHADSTTKHPHKHVNESINMINFIDITCEDRFQEVLKIKKSNHPFSGSTTSPSDSFSSLTPFETNSSPKTDIDIIDPILERFTDEPALIYLFPPGDDDDDLFDFKSDNEEWKKLFDSTLLEESSEIATLISSPFGNEDKVFNPGILILGGTQIFPEESKDKDLKMNSSTEALLILVENNFLSHSSDRSSDREILFFLESTVTETLLSFSSENEDKVFNPGIPISK